MMWKRSGPPGAAAVRSIACEETFAVDRLGKNFCVRDLEPLRVKRVGREEKSVQAGEIFA